MRRFFSVSEAAKALDVTERTVWNYIRRGELTAYRKKYGKPGKKRTWIEALSLKKCIIRRKKPMIYGAKKKMIQYFKNWEMEKLYMKLAMQEVGLMNTEIGNLSYFSENDSELDDLIEKYTEYWDKYDVAAYMGVSLSTVKRYIRKGKLKVAKVDKDRRNLFSSLDVMELIREINVGQSTGNESENIRAYYELCSFLKENPECAMKLKDCLEDL